MKTAWKPPLGRWSVSPWLAGGATVVLVLLAGVVSASERRPVERVYPVVAPGVRPPAPGTEALPLGLDLVEHAPAATSLVLSRPAHIAFYQGLEIISEVSGDRFSYRVEGSGGEWSTSPLAVDGPHSLTWVPEQGLFYATDADNHRLIAFADVAGTAHVATSTLAGVTLARPHDVVYDPASGWLYALDANRPLLFRFSAFGIAEAVLDLSPLGIGYSRGLCLVDGVLYVAASSAGAVIEVVDFAAGGVVVHPSYGKLVNAVAGSWETTGFVINDVERYGNYWYLSNYFAPAYANGSDHNRYKLVRFRDWEALATGEWEDLSQLLPDAQIPYFFTLHDGSLYLAAFKGVDDDDAVYRITEALFADGFESGDTGAWTTP